LVGCQSYQYHALTDSANDVAGEEIIGEGMVWEEYVTPVKRLNNSWLYRKCHDINSAVDAGVDYQVQITVYYGAGVSSGGDVYCNSKCKTDFGDIRFTDDDSTTELDYWIESKTDSVSAIFWVEVKDSLDSNVTIYIYYGNASATTTSNFDNTFIFGETWENATLNTDKWTVTGNPTYTIDTVNHYLEVTDMNVNCWFDGKGFHSKNPIVFPDNYRIEAAWTLPKTTGVGLGHTSMTFYTEIFGGLFTITHALWDVVDLGVAYIKVTDLWDYENTHIIALGVDGADDYSYWDHTNPAVEHVYYVTITKSALTGKIKIWMARYDGADGWFNEALYVDESSSEIPTAVHLGINRYIGFTFGRERFHDFKIRKFVSPEPTHSSWCEEETT